MTREDAADATDPVMSLASRAPGSGTGAASMAAVPSEAHAAIAPHDAAGAMAGATRPCAGAGDGLPHGMAIWRSIRPAHAYAEGTETNCATNIASATTRNTGRCIKRNNTPAAVEVPAGARRGLTPSGTTALQCQHYFH